MLCLAQAPPESLASLTPSLLFFYFPFPSIPPISPLVSPTSSTAHRSLPTPVNVAACLGFAYCYANDTTAPCPPLYNTAQCFLKGTLEPAAANPCACFGNRTQPLPPPPPPPPPPGPAAFTLTAGMMSASFGSAGLAGLLRRESTSNTATGRTITLTIAADGFGLQLNETVYASGSLAAPVCAAAGPTTAWCNYTLPASDSASGTPVAAAITVHYTLDLNGFVCKRVTAPPGAWSVGTVQPFRATAMSMAPAAALTASMLSKGPLGGEELGLLRFADNTGAFILAQNPLLALTLDTNASNPNATAAVTVAYDAGLNYDPGFYNGAPFAADAGCLGIYPLTNRVVPTPPRSGLSSLSTWTSAAVTGKRPAAAQPDAAGTATAGAPLASLTLDEAERDAVTACAAAHYIAPPTTRTVKMNVAWTENDYQMDMANATQAEEYHRVMQTLAMIRVQAITYAPSNSDLSSRANCTDSWCWEEALWFSLGELLRQDRWMPGRDPVPPTVATPLQWAKSLGVDLHPYIYPILAFVQNPEWLTPDHKQAYLGDPRLQNFILDTLGT